MGTVAVSLLTAGSVLGGVVSVALAAYAWRHRDVPAAFPYAVLTLTTGIWSFLSAAKFATSDPTVFLLLERVTDVVGVQILPLWLVFALVYTGHQDWISRQTLAVIWIDPVVYSAMVLTAGWHGLVRGTVTVETAGGVTMPVVEQGPIYYVQEPIEHLYVVLGFLLLLAFLFRSRNRYRRQTAAIIVGALFPAVSNALFGLGVSLHPSVTFTPVTFAVHGLVVGWALFRYDFLNVAPLAADVLVDELPDPVLVLDGDDVIVDHNPAATSVAGQKPSDEPVADVLPGLVDHLDADGVYTPSIDDAEAVGDVRFFDPRTTAIRDQHGNLAGRLVVLRDVTGQQRRQDRLEALQSATQEFIRAKTDAEIATLAVEFVDTVLEQHAAVVFHARDGALEPLAMSDIVAEHYDQEDLVIDDHDNPVWRTYSTGRRRLFDVRDEQGYETPFERALLVPLGDHGVLGIGSRKDVEAYAQEDEQFADILARTTQVALDQVEREGQLRASRVTLERRNEQMGFFHGILRHTLRNALLVIQGRADHLRDAVPDDQKRHLDSICEWSDDLDALNETIRSVSQTVTASESERLETVDIGDVLRECLDGIETKYDGDADVDVDVDVGDETSVRANELAVDVVDGVLRNAIVHNDEPRIELSITTRAIADRVQVQIADNGPGMSDELKETVFERELATGHTGGGFGLYFVSVIMDLYGGTVWFEDNQPRGTVAVLEFQAADEAVTTEAKGTSPPE